MGVACNPSCGSTAMTMWTESCDLRSMLLKGGIRQIIFFDCDKTFTDVTSASEWTTKKTATEFQITPRGNATFAQSEKEEIELDCDRMVVTKISKPIEFSSKLLDPTGGAHHDLIEDVNKYALNKTIMFVDCNNRLYYRFNWATTENPGFTLNKAFADLTEDAKWQQLVIMLEADFSTTNYQSLAMSAALQTAIGV